jgi:hypothetical protein
MALPHSFSELYPNRFLHADILKGKKVCLTVKDIFIENMEGEKKKKEPKVVVSFVERPLELVFAKTNGHCLKRMFGSDPHLWVGKRVVLFPSTTTFGAEIVECIRIWGSPDIEADFPISVPQGRKKPLEMVMHKIRPGEFGFKGSPNVAPAITDQIAVADDRMRELVGVPDAEVDYPDTSDDGPRDYGFGGE